MKKLLLTLAAAVGLTSASLAQIAYHNINPDTTVSTWDAFVVSPAALKPGQLVIWYHPTPEVVVNTSGSWEVLYTGGYPARLNMNDSVANSSGIWQAATYDALNSGGTGNWQTGGGDKYLGFRFHRTSGYNYGWLKMNVASDASSFTVKEYAYNTQMDQPIKAGAITATGVVNAGLGDDVRVVVKGKEISVAGADNGAIYEVSVVDMNGRVAKRAQLKGGALMDVSGLSAGAYVVRVGMEGYGKMAKVVLQ